MRTRKQPTKAEKLHLAMAVLVLPWARKHFPGIPLGRARLGDTMDGLAKRMHRRMGKAKKGKL